MKEAKSMIKGSNDIIKDANGALAKYHKLNRDPIIEKEESLIATKIQE